MDDLCLTGINLALPLLLAYSCDRDAQEYAVRALLQLTHKNEDMVQQCLWWGDLLRAVLPGGSASGSGSGSASGSVQATLAAVRGHIGLVQSCCLKDRRELVARAPVVGSTISSRKQLSLTPGIVEYRGGQQLLEVDAPRKTVRLTFGEVRADVLNVIPPQRAGAVAAMAGLITANERWCGVDFRSFESRVAPGIHVLGDAILAAPQMPKSGHMANGHAKVCAHAIAALLDGREPDPEPVIGNTCYSFVNDRQAVHVASVHRYDAAKRTMLVVDGTFGVSPGLNDREGAYAEAWARNIWADTLG
jgi:hypothetical protein